MIWHEGRIVDKSEVVVDLDDQIFEHGLGLFETLRTWHGHAPLLTRHLDRISTSARELNLEIADISLPDNDAVTRLLKANDLNCDALLRVTLTGGIVGKKPSVLWMTARPLPAPDLGPVKVVKYQSEAAHLDAHKSLNYWSRRLAHAWAESQGAADCLFVSSDETVREGSRHNMFIIPQGQPNTLVTPPLDTIIVPGIMRAVILELARERGYQVEERPIKLGECQTASAMYLTNSVRGVRVVGQFEDNRYDIHCVSELTRLLVEDLPKALLGKVPQ